MYSTRFISLLKNPTFKVYIPTNLFLLTSCKNINTIGCYNRPQNLINYAKSERNFSAKPAEKRKSIDLDDDNSLIVKIVKKIPFININKYRMSVVGLVLYESIADHIPYTEFMQKFSLPDTFYSWFCLTELHIWLLSTRCMSEGEDGRMVRNRLIEAMWTDVDQRVKKLGVGKTPLIRQQVKELSEQFKAALVSYDEGLLTDDVTLAGALWRRLYQMQDVDLEHLEILVRYIRRQIIYLDKIPTKELFAREALAWEFDVSK